MHLSEYLDLAELGSEIENGFIREAKHETLPLTLYTYTEKAQYAGLWPDATRKCRGLVVEDTGQIIARCLPKFFNYSEHVNGKSYAPPLELETGLESAFEIYSKMDGSYGSCFFYDDNWHVASKGSFHSEQAEWATKYLRRAIFDSWEDSPFAEKRNGTFDPLNRQKTYVCEIIYPSNRIVVDYGSLEDLVLLTVYDTETGQEEFTEDRRLEWGWVGSIVPSYNPWGINLDELQLLAEENVLLDEDNGDREVSGTAMEGYVVRLSDGTRVKIKLSDYLRLHKVLTNCTERSIWEILSTGGSLDDFMENTPDEFRDWVNSTVLCLKNDFEMLKNNVYHTYFNIFPKAMSDGGTRAKFAALAKDTEFPSAMFMMLDASEAKLNEWLWKQIKPEATKPFTKAE
jgi:RNA ligase